MNNPHPPEWPPQYSVRKHPRARRVKLRMSFQKGLELVTPLRFNLKKIPAILEENRKWIEKQFAAFQGHLKKNSEETQLPQQIIFHAMQQTWKIEYISNANTLKLLSRPQYELVLFGDTENVPLVKKLLTTWIKAQAKQYLLHQLTDLSEKLNLPIRKAIVRDQKTRWGSCSENNAISLNYKLIFLPVHLVQHIIIHELCHTIHLNHSDKFWQLVATFDEQWKQNRKEIRKVSSYIPTWILTQ